MAIAATRIGLESDRVASALSRVTATMLRCTFHPAPTIARPPAWRLAVLAIPGSTPLTVALSSDQRGCAALASAMLGIADDELDLAMIDDVLRELTNMTAGQLKLELKLDQALGLPRLHDDDAVFASNPWTHHILASASTCLAVSLTSFVF